MNIIKANNVNDVFIKVSNKLLKEGEIISPRDQETKELTNTLIEVKNPGFMICSLKERDLNKQYLEAELNWYINGTLDCTEIEKYSKFWSKLKNEKGEVNSNYGYIATKQKVNQIKWCIKCLKEDYNSRQAVINYNQPIHKYKNNKDFVCTLTQQFMIRKGKLDTIVNMRSNDLIYGFTYDAPWFAYLQTQISIALGLEQGRYYHFASSMHVYKKHYKMLKDIADAKQ
tara:strand:+ start:2692 stop:3375 length:684 start_codon:yes stop_codon:yes gene_type:complete